MASMNSDREIFPIDENDTDVMVTLTLDDDSELDCEILIIFEIEGQDYIALMPVDEKGDFMEETGVLLYRYFETSDGTPVLDNIDSDEEAALVSDTFDELLEDMPD